MSNDRPAHKQYEARLIQLLRRRFEQLKFKFEDHLKVGELPLEIDVIVITPDEKTPPNFSELPELFNYFRRYNVMEVKTEGDRLEPKDLLKLQAYGWLYMEKQEIYNLADMTLTALVHHLGAEVMEILPKLGYRPITKDIFRRDGDMVSYVIAFEDLPDKLTIEELKAFSNPAQRQSIILSELERGQSSPTLDAILELYESEVFKFMAIKQETLNRFVETFGTEKILSLFRKEDILAKLHKEDHLAALRKEDLLAALGKEDLLAALSKEDMLRQILVEYGPSQLHQMIDQISGNKTETH